MLKTYKRQKNIKNLENLMKYVFIFCYHKYNIYDELNIN